MSIRLKYETKAGAFSEGESYMQLQEYLRLAMECSATIGHFKKENDDLLRGEGFLQLAKQLDLLCHFAQDLATRGLKQ